MKDIAAFHLQNPTGYARIVEHHAVTVCSELSGEAGVESLETPAREVGSAIEQCVLLTRRMDRQLGQRGPRYVDRDRPTGEPDELI